MDQVRRQWGKLTDEDLATINGDREVFIGKIQTYYGRTREQVQRDLARGRSLRCRQGAGRISSSRRST
jgi:uncharacterized protein YjbJ (UPF0337 family)